MQYRVCAGGGGGTVVKEADRCSETHRSSSECPAAAWRVVAAVDPDRRSMKFEDYASRYAGATGGEPIFVQAYERATQRHPRPFDWLYTEGDNPFGPNHVVLHGDPAAVILRHAEFAKANVILTGWRPVPLLTRLWRRSVSADILQGSSIPVQLVREDRLPRRAGRLEELVCLVNLDGTDEAAVELSAFLAAKTGASVTYLYVLPEISEGLLAWGTADRDLPLLREPALQRLEAAVGHVPVSHRAVVAKGSVRAALARESRKRGADLIVVSQPGTEMPHMPRPSAHAILRRVDCAVLSVPVRDTLHR